MIDDSVSTLKGIGPSIAAKLERRGIRSILDLLVHLPYRYQDRSKITALSEVRVGDECFVIGQIVDVQYAYGRRRSLVATIEDGRGYLSMRLFHFNAHQKGALQNGLWLRLFGEARMGPKGLEMVHPEYRAFPERPEPPHPELRPVYPATEGITSNRMSTWLKAALEQRTDLPAHRFDDMTLAEALTILHTPTLDGASRINDATNRLALDELLAYFLVMKRRQAAARRQETTPLPPARQLGRELLRNVGFTLTGAQRQATTAVLNDLSQAQPMMRLIQGDVGSGKTIVAAFAAIRTAENSAQTAVMAPTEILAEQHYENFSNWLSPLGIGVCLLTGRQSAKERRARLAAVESGDDLVVIGTHALFQSGVVFRHLGLTIVDEQHRFGVHQRMQLRDKGRLPHQLVMTATPIPRTLTMALYADMDVTVIDELPPGRIPVTTTVHSDAKRDAIIGNLADDCGPKAQAYWVCTAIEEGETDLHAAEAVFDELTTRLAKLRIGLVHGRLKPAEKAQTMAAFKAGEIDVLVATTVIEVGVDVPTATSMIIDDADRLGLAQLHQLRGRVGRGGTQSRCALLYQSPVSDVAKQRLQVMRDSNDGFAIAEKDLELRGPGDIMGTRQTGERSFRVVDLARDRNMITRVARLGTELLEEDSETADAIIATWTRSETGYAAV